MTTLLIQCFAAPEEQRARAIPKDSQDSLPTNSPFDSSQTRSTSVQPPSGSKASELELSTHVGGKRKRNVKAKDGKKGKKPKKQDKMRTFVVSDDDEEDEDEEIASFAVGSPNAGFKVDNRPQEVAYWVGRGRKSVPPIKDLPSFEAGWWNWWKGLQPNWQSVAEVEGPLTTTHCEVTNGEGGWASLDKHGQNAFLTILSCLVWWGIALNGRQGESAAWMAAVADVHWVLSNLVSTTRYVLLHFF